MSKIVAKDLVAAQNWKTDCLELIVAELEYLKQENYWIAVMAEEDGEKTFSCLSSNQGSGMAFGAGPKMSRRLEAICVANESLSSVGVLMV
ncbi:uncharacterized protein [Montipora capricornis]|uniref:uncharacterized protein isoform X4 n=1 Tax=Montipora capricornis TaxID=246305 RepID=UPI0035F1464D